MKIKEYNEIFKKWGLSGNPFGTTPPDEIEQIAAIFHGRDHELDMALFTLYDGKNVLIRGTWGIGKTALIKTLLYRLQQEIAEIKEEMLVLYLSGIPKATTIDFYRAVLLAVTTQMSGQSEEAKKVAENLTGMAVQNSKIKKEGGVSFGVFSYKVTSEPNAADIRENEIYQQLLYWLHEAEEIYGRVVIAIDDLDKKDTPIAQEIIENSLDLFRQGAKRAFVMTGRGFTDLQQATIFSLGVFSEDINLQPMSNDDLRQIVINYLNTKRQEQNDSIAPFTTEVLDQIIEAAQGIPRQLNYICEKVIRQAAVKQFLEIDLTAWQIIWPEMQNDLLKELTPHLRRLLSVAYEEGGINENISNATLDQLGVITFNALLPELKQLESKDLMTRVEGDRGYSFVPSKLYLPPVKE
jgi:Cdc6-like AAA superfamily ATPase